MRTVAIVQARMSSTRLPGKVLLEISGRTMLDWVVTRLRRTPSIDEIVVATTARAVDDPIVAACRRLGVPWHRGSEQDVLARYHDAARQHEAEAVIRVTSDCPLIDPGEVERVARVFADERPSYAANFLAPGFLHGLDAEIMTMEALTRAFREATADYERVHVTPYLYRHPELFDVKVLPLPFDRDVGGLRWTVDTPEDLDVVRALVAELGDDRFSFRDALAAVDRLPSIARLNAHVRPKRLEDG